MYQVKVNAPIARDAKYHILEACVIAAVVAFHKLDPDKLIFISIHFCYGFLPSGGKERRNPRPLDVLPNHTDLFIDDKLGHFILQKIYNAASKPPAKLQTHTKYFWPKCNQYNKSGGGHQFKSKQHQQYPLHSPNITPVGVSEECPLEFNLHQEHPIEESNVSLDGDKVHRPVILPTSFKTQDGVTQHGGIQNSGNTSPGSHTTTHGNRGIKDNQHQFNNNEE